MQLSILFISAALVFAAKRNREGQHMGQAGHDGNQRTPVKARRDINPDGVFLDRSEIPSKRSLYESLLPGSKDATCTSTIFANKVEELLNSWDSNQARGLWLWCMDAGVIYSVESVEAAVTLFKRSITLGDFNLLKDSADSLNPILLKIFVAMYLREYRLNELMFASQELRDAVNALLPEDFSGLSLLAILASFLSRYQSLPELYQSVTLSQPLRIARVKLFALAQYLSTSWKEQLLNHLDVPSITGDLEVMDMVVDFCRTYDVDIGNWAVSKLSVGEQYMLLVCIRKDQALPEYLEMAHAHCRSSAKLLAQFVAFVSQYQREWGVAHFTGIEWALMALKRPDLAHLIPPQQ